MPLELRMNLNSIWTTGFNDSVRQKAVAGEEKVIIPGDPEREMEAERSMNGIPLVKPVVEDLKGLAAKLEIPF